MDSDERFQQALDRSLPEGHSRQDTGAAPAGVAGDRAPLDDLSPEDRQAIDLACRLAGAHFTPRPAWQAGLRQRLGRSSRAATRRSWRPLLQAAGEVALLAGLVLVLSLAFKNLRPQPGAPAPAIEPTTEVIPSETALPATGDPTTSTPYKTEIPAEVPPFPLPTEAPTPGRFPILYTVQAGDTLNKIAFEAGIAVENLMALNGSTGLSPDGANLVPGMVLVVGYQDTYASPLTLGSPTADFRQRIVHPEWQSLWVEGVVTTTLPDGTQQIAYSQAWLSRDGRGRVIRSDDYPSIPQNTRDADVTPPLSLDTPVRWVAVSDGERRVLKDLQTGETSDMPTQPGTNGADQWVEHPLEASSPLTAMLFPFQFALLSSDVQVVQEVTAAGRSAIEVRWGGSTLWVDAETGVILREQKQTQGSDGQTVQIEVGLTQIVFNPSLPEGVTRTDDLETARFEPIPGSMIEPLAPRSSAEAAAPECTSYSGSEAQQAVGFTILAPSPVPNDLPLSQINVCNYPDGKQFAQLIYYVPSPQDPHSGNPGINLIETSPEEAITPEGLANQFRIPALDLHEAQVRGTTGYLYWTSSVSGGNAALLEWNEGGVSYRLSLSGNWPQPSEQNPRLLDQTLLDIANSLLPAWPTNPTPTPSP